MTHHLSIISSAATSPTKCPLNDRVNKVRNGAFLKPDEKNQSAKDGCAKLFFHVNKILM